MHHGASANIPNAEGIYPIHIACKYGSVEVIEYLINEGTKLNIYTADGLSPFDFAVMNGHNNVIKTLLKYVFAIYGNSF